MIAEAKIELEAGAHIDDNVVLGILDCRDGKLTTVSKPEWSDEMIEKMTPAAGAWLEQQVRRYHDGCQYVQMRATEARDLHMYTDASLQNPPPGIIMPEYVT